MITLKYWNSLTPQSRASIAARFIGSSFYADSLKGEYHHNFDYDATGRMLKTILSACYLKGKCIEVRCIITPIFAIKSSAPTNSSKSTKSSASIKSSKSSASIKSIASIKSTTPPTYRYYFRMYTESDPDDGESIFEDAHSEQEARSKAYEDFHSITELRLMRRQKIQ